MTYLEQRIDELDLLIKNQERWADVAKCEHKLHLVEKYEAHIRQLKEEKNMLSKSLNSDNEDR